MKSKESEEGVRLPFINVLKIIEYGESANITINGKQYNISVNANDGKYYIEDESFRDREDFINGIYNKTSIQLSKNSIIILNSVADGTLKANSSWTFEDEYKNQINEEKNKKYKLRKNIIIKLIALYIFIFFTIFVLYKEIKMCNDTNLHITVYKLFQSRFSREEWFSFSINKIIIAVLLTLNNISILLFKENRMRLIKLFKYSKEEINEIEEKTLAYTKENLIFGGTFDICFSEQSLILTKKADFKIINYQDIIYILNMRENSLQNERAICIITRDKKIIKMGNIIHIEEFKKKILEKNHKIIFKKYKDINKNEIIDLKYISINKILLKDIITTNYKIYSKAIAIYPALYYLINLNLLNDLYAANNILAFIFCGFFIFLISCFIAYNKIKIQ